MDDRKKEDASLLASFCEQENHPSVYSVPKADNRLPATELEG